MQVKCPKCGFEQPQDQYCAKCGIDMQHYKPTPTPTWKKIIQSPYLHLIWIFFLVFTSIQFIQKNRRDELQQRIAYLKNGPVVIEKRLDSDTGREVQVSANEQSEEALAGQGSSTTVTTLISNKTANPNALGGKNDVNEREIKIKVRYLELDQTTLNQWFEEMRSHGQFRQFDNVSMGVLPQIKNHLHDRGIKELQNLDKKASVSNATEWFSGTHHSNEVENEYGLLSSLVIHEIKDGVVRGDYEVQRINRGSERVSFGSPFETSTSSAYVIAGLLPRSLSQVLDEDMNPDPFLSVLKSRRFLNRQDEFTLIIEFDMNNSSTTPSQEGP